MSNVPMPYCNGMTPCAIRSANATPFPAGLNLSLNPKKK